jgi:hypothetical protein
LPKRCSVRSIVACIRLSITRYVFRWFRVYRRRTKREIRKRTYGMLRIVSGMRWRESPDG